MVHYKALILSTGTILASCFMHAMAPEDIPKELMEESYDQQKIRDLIRAESPLTAAYVDDLERKKGSVTIDTTNPLIHWSCASDMGGRFIQQDYASFTNPTDDCPFAAACVADGHGHAGAFISYKVATTLPKIAIEKLKATDLDDTQKVESIITAAFETTEKHILKHMPDQALVHAESTAITRRSGAPAVVALLEMTQKKLIIAHVGDCRALLVNCMTSESQWLTTDHRPENTEEKIYIESCGGIVTRDADDPGDPPRINGTVNMSRAFCDDVIKKWGLTCEPSVDILDILPVPHALVLCSDGLTETPYTSTLDSAEKLGALTLNGLHTDNPATYIIKNRPYDHSDNATAVVGFIYPFRATKD